MSLLSRADRAEEGGGVAAVGGAVGLDLDDPIG
jgi:hypothetical protein